MLSSKKLVDKKWTKLVNMLCIVVVCMALSCGTCLVVLLMSCVSLGDEAKRNED